CRSKSSDVERRKSNFIVRSIVIFCSFLNDLCPTLFCSRSLSFLRFYEFIHERLRNFSISSKNFLHGFCGFQCRSPILRS
ncbi:hypothetical protein PFISCL1PPCAC_28483, partial [Pristionchus fissidentatus]